MTAPLARKPQPEPACAMCGKPADAKYRPFCSKRCADVDLSRWLGGKYAIPAVEPPDEWETLPDPEGGEGAETGGY